MAPRHRTICALSAAALLSLAGCAVALSPTETPTASASLSQSEHSALEIRTVAGCLSGQGWDVTVTADGVLEASVPTAQARAYESANTDCREGFLAAHPRPGLGEAELGKLYEHQLFLMDCLKGKGYPPVQQPPSKQDYVATGLAGKTNEFYAWSAVGNVSGREVEQLARDCPQDPPGL